jgi:hypothetical protein
MILRLLCVLAALVAGASGCSRPPALEIELALGPERSFRFAPSVGFAEYYQLADGSDRLRVTLASYAADCAHHVPVPEGALSVALHVESPMGRALVPGEFSMGASGEATQGGTASSFVRLHADSRSLNSPGRLKLHKLEPRQHGLVEGEVHQVPTPGQDPVALTGSFRVRICRAVLDGNRKAQP